LHAAHRTPFLQAKHAALYLPPVLDSRRRWTLALVATATMAVSYVDRQTLSVLAPQVSAALSLSETQYGWLASAFSMAYLVGTPLGGRVIGLLGARRGLVLAVLLWSAVAAAHALAPSYTALFALRIALGLAEAPAFPGAAFTVQRALPEADRPRGMGILFTGSSFGAMVAPRLATGIYKRFGWRPAFLGSALVGLAWIPLWLWASRGEARELLESAPSGQQHAPIDWAALLGRPALQRALAVVLASAPTAAMMLLWGSKYLVRTFHVDPGEVDRYLILPPLLYDLGSVLFGDRAARRARAGVREVRDLVALAALLTACVAGLGLLPGPGWASVIMGLALGGVAALFALVTAEALSGVLPHEVPVASGLLAAVQSLAYIVASPLIGLSVDRTGSYRLAGLALAAWVAPGVAYWIARAPRLTLEADRRT
jgi:ACS family hexuronate transporter-like MFS transporter